MAKNYRRAIDILAESSGFVNEAQTRDATPSFQQLMDSVPNVAQAVGSALGEARGVASSAKNAIDAISSAAQTANSIGVEQNAIIDNINAAQQADPSQSIITLTDHRNGVQQAYNILSTIVSSLATANALCAQLNALASRQFL